jgi:hypothetical protein
MRVRNERHIEALLEVPDLNSEGGSQTLGLAAWRQKSAFIDHGDSVVMVPVPDREALPGIAGGANADNYRDRNDRY